MNALMVITIAIQTPGVQINLVTLSVNVSLASKETVEAVLISMNVKLEVIFAIRTLHVAITIVDIPANAIPDIKVMVSHALTLMNAPLAPTIATPTPNAQIIRVHFHVAVSLATKETAKVVLISMNV